jgi:hypothetical protein
MNRLFSSLFAGRNNSPVYRASASRKRSVFAQVEGLEQRWLPAVLAPGTAPAVVTSSESGPRGSENLIARASRDVRRDETLAVTLLNDAAKLADDAHDPIALAQIAIEWARMKPGRSGYSGTTSANFFSQALGAAYYWMEPDQGSGSGADYARGSNQLTGVINQALGSGGIVEILSGAESTRDTAEGVQALAENASNYASTLDDMAVPPIAGGTWQVNIGGDDITFTITQSNDGTRADGLVANTTNQVYGTIADTTIQAIGNNWYRGSITLTWSNTGGSLTGLAEGDAEDSNHM